MKRTVPTAIAIFAGLTLSGPATLFTAEKIREANLNCADYPQENMWRDEDCGAFPYWDGVVDRVIKHEKDYPYAVGFVPYAAGKPLQEIVRTGPNPEDFYYYTYSDRWQTN